MSMKLLLLFIAAAEAVKLIKADNNTDGIRRTDYCKLPTCIRNSHTLCRFKWNRAGRHCHTVLFQGLTEEEKQKIVDIHVELRNKVYRGWERMGEPGAQLASSSMANLTWDEELANIAQRWSDQCINNNDYCRNVPRFIVGQNFALEATFGNLQMLKVDWPIRKWYSEVRYFNRNNVFYYRTNAATKHYTQMVWGETRTIGCGAVRFNDNINIKLFLVCNYGPSGNIPGEPVYRVRF